MGDSENLCFTLHFDVAEENASIPLSEPCVFCNEDVRDKELLQLLGEYQLLCRKDSTTGEVQYAHTQCALHAGVRMKREQKESDVGLRPITQPTADMEVEEEKEEKEEKEVANAEGELKEEMREATASDDESETSDSAEDGEDVWLGYTDAIVRGNELVRSPHSTTG